jgi:DNA-binding NarL/FixJ family response regulator
MVSDVETLSTVIGRIYDAALDPSQWPDVLEKIGGFVQGSASNIFAEDSVSRASMLFHIWGVERPYVDSYLNYYVQLNPFTIANYFLGVEEQMSVADMMTHDEFRETRFYQEWARPQGWIDAMAVVLDKSVTSYAAFGVFRHERDGIIDDVARQRVKLIAPHVRRSILIGNVIDLRTNETGVMADTLSGLAAGVILVGANARITYANRAGAAMLQEGRIISGKGGIFAATNHQADKTLRDAFLAAESGDIAVGRKGTAVLLSASQDERWLAHTLPLTAGQRRQAAATHTATTAVFIRKASLETPAPLEIVAKIYKLTPTELRVLQAVTEVSGVPSIADALGISQATVKTHLQHLFRKTGARSQIELIKLLAGHKIPLVEL